MRRVALVPLRLAIGAGMFAHGFAKLAHGHITEEGSDDLYGPGKFPKPKLPAAHQRVRTECWQLERHGGQERFKV